MNYPSVRQEHDGSRSQLENFEIVQKIGKGAYSTVWKVRRKNDD